jgi:redox-sensitive bicupin YhaK (pirin superfamily)
VRVICVSLPVTTWQQGPAYRGPAAFTPIDVWDVRLNAGASTELQARAGHTLALVVLHGTLLVNGQEIARAGQLVHMDRAADSVHLEANSDVTLLWLSASRLTSPWSATARSS